MQLNLEGKVALITGAGSGIGQAAAILLAKEGVKIGAVGRTPESLDKTVKAIEKVGGKAIALTANVSQPDQIEKAVQKLSREYGRLDITFANAGINGVWAPIEELKPEEWNQTISTNLTGTFLTVKYATPYLKRQGGSIIITSSVNGTRMFSNTGATAYSCTKAAQVAFAKMLALELAPSKIRVNVICPGAIETEIEESTKKRDLEEVSTPVEFPQGSMPLSRGPGRPEEVANLVAFLASEVSSHLTGTEIWVDGAESLLRG